VSAALPLEPQALRTERDGWRVCIASGIVAALGGAMLWGSSLGIFMRPLEQSFGWSRADIAFGITLLTLTTPLLAPLAGWLVDRVDLRRLVLVSLLLQAATLAAAGAVVSTLAAFYVLCIVMAAVSYGASVLPLSKIVIAWFGNARGRALGVLFALASLGPIVHPLLAQWLVEQVGWRGAYFWLAGLVLALGVAAAALGVHERALPPAGVAPARAVPTPRAAALLVSRAFWGLSLWGALYAFGAGAIGLHLAPLMLDRGATPMQAALAPSLLGVGLLIGNLMAGALLDRISSRLLAVALMAGPVVATLLLLALPSVAAGLVASLVLGLAAGAESSLLTFMVGQHFDHRLYGRAYALLSVPMAIAAGIGPWVGGLLFGSTGDYAAALSVSGVLFIAAAAAARALIPVAGGSV
jgi:MFS family permease